MSTHSSILWAFLVAQTVKNLPVTQETQVWFLGREDTLEKGMATHSSILAWRIPWSEELGRLQSVGSQRVGHGWEANTFTWLCFFTSKLSWGCLNNFPFEWVSPLDMMSCGCHITGLWMILTGNEIVVYIPICHKTQSFMSMYGKNHYNIVK